VWTVVRLGSVARRDEPQQFETRRDAAFLPLRPSSAGGDKGSGVAIGRNPHNARHLRDGVLIAPLGDQAKLAWGAYFAIVGPRSAERPVVKKFVTWLHDEVRRDAQTEGDNKAAHRRRSP
jgi:DNA-binding transcriptional LysR family regulator